MTGFSPGGQNERVTKDQNEAMHFVRVPHFRCHAWRSSHLIWPQPWRFHENRWRSTIWTWAARCASQLTLRTIVNITATCTIRYFVGEQKETHRQVKMRWSYGLWHLLRMKFTQNVCAGNVWKSMTWCRSLGHVGLSLHHAVMNAEIIQLHALHIYNDDIPSVEILPSISRRHVYTAGRFQHSSSPNWKLSHKHVTMSRLEHDKSSGQWFELIESDVTDDRGRATYTHTCTYKVQLHCTSEHQFHLSITTDT